MNIYLNQRTKWNSNPYTLGSYSFIQVNGSAKEDISNLSEPVWIDQIVSAFH